MHSIDNFQSIGRNSLVVFGSIPQGVKDEDSRAVVVDMLKQQVNLNINTSTAHRFGAPRSGGPDKYHV